jgi:hypothetical protein
MAKLDPDHGSIVFPDHDAIIASARAGEIAALIVDPFIRSHELDENSNPHMDAAIAAWSAVAKAVDCAVMLVHHVRKGPATGIEAARGVKAMTDAARVGLLLTTMTTDEAEDIGIDSADAHRFVRLDNAKANMAPAGAAAWFEMVETPLGNKTPLYPNGDMVSALVRWKKPSAFDALDPFAMAKVFDELSAGPGDGEQYTLTRRGEDNARWAGFVLVRAGLNDVQATTILRLWAQNGVVTPSRYHSTRQRKQLTGITLNAVKIAEMTTAPMGPYRHAPI